MSTKVSIIDDDYEYLQRFEETLQPLDTIQCVSVASSVESFLENLPAESPQLLFLDIHLADKLGLDYIPQLKETLPDTDIIILSVEENTDQFIRAFRLGAVGYLIKKNTLDDIEAFVEIAAKGGAIMSAEVAKAIFSQWQQGSEAEIENLTEREWEILELLAEGWSYKHIADQVNLSIDSIRFWMKRIYRALHVNSKGEAINLYFKSISGGQPPKFAPPRQRGRPPLS